MSVKFFIVLVLVKTAVDAQLSSLTPLLGRIKDCLSDANPKTCLKDEVLGKLDNVLQDNSSWPVNDFISLEKNPEWNVYLSDLRRSDSTSDWKSRLLYLLKSRFLKVQMPTLFPVEGRKKKNKGGKGGYAMMGGMAMLGLMAQMIIGKLFLLAGAAFILSKIALIYSILSSFKKSGGSSTDHIVYADSSGGHSDHGSSSWHRSAPGNIEFVDPYDYGFRQKN